MSFVKVSYYYLKHTVTVDRLALQRRARLRHLPLHADVALLPVHRGDGSRAPLDHNVCQ